ncbi:MAG: ethanolamine ammonia-lyase subunit EutB [Pseudonocardia sp.]|nr:ethanolamine ammonia-lyase subunit EutB [Pseudonocardia sp.]
MGPTVPPTGGRHDRRRTCSRGGGEVTVRQISLGGHGHRFADLKALLAAATPERSGDVLAGVAASSEQERVAAQTLLADLPLATFLDELVIPYEDDEVTRLIVDSHDMAAFAPVASMTVGALRDHLLAPSTDTTVLAAGLTPEMVAAVSKLMRVQDLISVARRTPVVTAFRTTLGLPGTMATRLQPNHPTDDPTGVTASIVDGLLMGCGDAVIGINPATDSPNRTVELLHLIDDVRLRYDIPTQSCVLAHVTTSIEIMERGAPVDLVFQSIAGTQAANTGFGVTLELLREAHQAVRRLDRGTVGNRMYFETGQGSALSADAHHGVDQQTLEVRAYGVAREFDPLLLNTVVGFIGPEYLYDGKQIIRAGLEDHFCGKLLGVPMGVDVCYTNHAEADADDTDTLLTLLGVAGCSFVICVPGGDDVMLHYQSLSFHDALYVRQALGLAPAPEFADWLRRMDLLDADGRVRELGGAAVRALTAGMT